MDSGNKKYPCRYPFKTVRGGSEAKIQPEKESHEFSTFCFEEISETGEISLDFWTPLKDTIKHLEITHDESAVKELHLPLSTKQMIQLQKNDTEARNIIDKLRKEKNNAKMFILHDGVLYRLWTEERETFRCTFVPELLRDHISTQSKWPQWRTAYIHGLKENVLLAWYEE